jgi:hypothetical protein
MSSLLPEKAGQRAGPRRYDKKIELWFSNDRFERIAGGKREGQALKKMLAKMGRLMIWGRGKGPPGSVDSRS